MKPSWNLRVSPRQHLCDRAFRQGRRTVTGQRKKAAKHLQEIADETGGKFYFPESADEVEAICTQVAHEIRNQYTLGYKPTNTRRDGTWRVVTVKLNPSANSKKLVARTKRGYYAPTES